MADHDDVFAGKFPNGFSIRDEANALVALAFRNGPLEDLHAGKHSPLLDDPSLSRITDAEMKVLMINACEKVEQLLRLKQDDPTEYDRTVKSASFIYCLSWER
ncbi:hypothetical protein [Planctomicrobium sp. SH664]|uniref:hypothetical protein n=1 Tax=Planctomicrobium sp. SH664 TaxID=3448125 RepID=UPI003F5C7A98